MWLRVRMWLPWVIDYSFESVLVYKEVFSVWKSIEAAMLQYSENSLYLNRTVHTDRAKIQDRTNSHAAQMIRNSRRQLATGTSYWHRTSLLTRSRASRRRLKQTWLKQDTFSAAQIVFSTRWFRDCGLCLTNISTIGCADKTLSLHALCRVRSKLLCTRLH